MAKEKVIIFEGEHNFVAPKNHVTNKATGMTHYVPDEVNLIPSPTSATQPSSPTLGGAITRPVVDAASSTNITTNTPIVVTNPNISKTIAPPPPATIPTTTSTLTTTTTKPISFGSAPVGGGGGGGGKKEEAAPQKTFLQKYWWAIAIAVVGIGGYIYYKKKK
jgi:hypothetical protein